MIILPTEKRFDARYAPTVLFGIVLLNVLVFFFYQSNDDNKISTSLKTYLEQDFLSLEWPHYQTYLKAKQDKDSAENLALAQDYFEHQAFEHLATQIVLDTDFYEFLFRDPYNLIGHKHVEVWSEKRSQINRDIQSLSFFAYGLIPRDLRIVTLLTNQFLHGDTLHLLGNMFFLIICGFAVEAAIGHWRFLAFYLTSGVVASLAHAALDFTSAVPLVGASGAISGVMAMYLAVFKLRKIEFFYWLFIFVGYFRAPALIILPIYIGKELFSFFTDTQSNVAVMAHAGGFITGALLMLANHKFSPTSIDTDYVETDQTIDPLQKNLAVIQSDIENFRFDSAFKNTQAAIVEHGQLFELLNMQRQLAQLKSPDLQTAAELALLNADTTDLLEIHEQAKLLNHQSQPGNRLSVEQLCRLGLRFCQLENLKPAEKVFALAQEKHADTSTLSVLAKKITAAFTQQNNGLKAKHYQALVIKLMDGAA